MEDETPRWVSAVVGLMAVAIGGYGLWCTVIAFMGGTLPFTGIQLGGGVVSGLLFLFVVEPIIVTVGYWISALCLLPVVALARMGRRNQLNAE